MTRRVSRPAARPQPGWRHRGIALLGAVAVCALILEAGLRLALGAPIRWRFPQESYVPDAQTGYRLRPLQTAFTHAEPVRTNALGLRDEEYGPQPAAGTVRILAIGDSQTFGVGLPAAETWPKQLEGELQGRFPSCRWEVVNGGLPGSDVWQHEVLMRELGTRLRPHRVILAFYVNDVTAAPPRTGHAVQEQGWKRRVLYALKRSALISALATSREAARAAVGLPSWSYVKEDSVLRGGEDEAVRRGWEQVERSLGAMAQLARSNGDRLWVVALPRRDQVLGALDTREYQAKLARIAERSGAAFLDVLEPLRAAYSTHGSELFIAWDGHNAGPTNRVIADALVEQGGESWEQLARVGACSEAGR